MRLVCSEKDTIIPLEQHLASGSDDPLVVCFEPFTGERMLTLEAPVDPGFRGICSHLDGQHESFTVPRYITSFGDTPDKTYFLIGQGSQGYTVLFCLSHQNMTTFLASTPSGDGKRRLTLNISSGDSRESHTTRSALLCVCGKNLNQTINRTMQMALELTGNLGKLVEDKLLPSAWLSKLGWESGASFGREVSHDKIIHSVVSLRESGFQPGFVLVDEGWQELGSGPQAGAMLSFEADPVRFPHGLKGLIDDLHAVGVKHVGVWHGMMGYRGGVHPQLAEKYGLSPDPTGRHYLGYDLGRTFHFFHDFYGYLREQGVTFIKVGDQGSAHTYCSPGIDVTMLYRNLQTAMQAAASIQFNSTHFNTDCLHNENLFYWTTSSIARAAADTAIHNPEGVMRAIRNNLTNSLWLQHLMHPDFDAWMTNTPQSEPMAIFHALSGSINVISDPPGEHNKQLIRKIALPCGTVLKADRPLSLCEDSIFCDPLTEKKIYKAFTFKAGNGILAAFNLNSCKRSLHGEVSPADIDGLQGERFAVFSHHNGFVAVVGARDKIAITLKAYQSDILTFAPVKHGIAVIGCYSFFLAPGPLTEVNIEEDSMHISSLVEAPLIIYCEREILEIRCNGAVVPWEYDSKRKALSIDSRSKILNTHSIYSITFES